MQRVSGITSSIRSIICLGLSYTFMDAICEAGNEEFLKGVSSIVYHFSIASTKFESKSCPVDRGALDETLEFVAKQSAKLRLMNEKAWVDEVKARNDQMQAKFKSGKCPGVVLAGCIIKLNQNDVTAYSSPELWIFCEAGGHANGVRG